MKRFILTACAGLFAAALALPLSAADYSGPAYKSPIDTPDYAAFNWTGLYVGLNGGCAFGKSNWTSLAGSSGDFDISGGLVGGTLGFNLQTGVWVWGLEADIDASWIKGNGCGGGFCESRNSSLSTVMGAWSAKIEYLYVDLRKTSCRAATCGLNTDVTFKTSIARVGVNYRF